MLPATRSAQMVHYALQLDVGASKLPKEVVREVSEFAADGIDDQIGGLVDVRDVKTMCWFAGRIDDIKQDSKEVLVHFLGWDEKWDNWISLYGDNIMPFGSKIEEFPMNRGKPLFFSVEKKDRSINVIDKLITKDLLSMGISEQELRRLLKRTLVNSIHHGMNTFSLWRCGKLDKLSIQSRVSLRKIFPRSLLPVLDDELASH
eukprot:TRINITY_DN16834_c0_g1_i1.p1 TRINITY_DN16834_c0_g1~~TRINITY_DN16834_c0_g1_i1.p1  ORF type:complete len:203 (+),score=30.85 TRINITY_DN16834_c0_g1_i1:33-641(+)